MEGRRRRWSRSRSSDELWVSLKMTSGWREKVKEISPQTLFLHASRLHPLTELHFVLLFLLLSFGPAAAFISFFPPKSSERATAFFLIKLLLPLFAQRVAQPASRLGPAWLGLCLLFAHGTNSPC